jgi:predicted nucleic acid-binding protein
LSEIVLDASTTLSWCFPDEQAPSSIAVLDRLQRGDSALVPASWCLEVVNSLLAGERRGRITQKQTDAFLASIQALGPTLDHTSLEQVVGPVQQLSRRHGLSPYDALYIESALRTRSPLASLDQFQLEAAKVLGIECL